MFGYLFEKLFCLLESPVESPTETPKKLPTEEPGRTVPVPRRKRKHPLEPEPGISPEPKGISAEINKFLQSRNLGIEEAFDPGKYPSFVHPDKENWISSGDDQLKEILPNLSDSEQSYLEMIASNSYQEMLGRLEKYTSVQITQESLPGLVGLLQSTLRKVLGIEADRKDYLEQLALSSVLDLPEFEMVKDAYENGLVDFDVKLDQPELNWDVDIEKEEDLSGEETLNLELAKEFEEVRTEEELRRRMANLLIQGSSVLKLYLFNLVNPELKEIDSNLPNMYGILGALAQLGYWITPDGIEQSARGEGEAGSAQVVPQGDTYTIKVRAITFPYLVHELTKGIYEWVSLDPELRRVMKKETPESETKDIMIGSELFKIISSYLGKGKESLLPLVHKKFLGLNKMEKRDILSKNSSGKDIMDDLIGEAEEEWKEYFRNE